MGIQVNCQLGLPGRYSPFDASVHAWAGGKQDCQSGRRTQLYPLDTAALCLLVQAPQSPDVSAGHGAHHWLLHVLKQGCRRRRRSWW